MKHDIDTQLARLRTLRWDGPDRNPRVEQFLKEQSNMNEHKKRKGLAVGMALALVLGGGAVAASVTHRIMAHRAVVQLDNGQTLEVDVVEDGDGRFTGTGVDEQGQTYMFEFVVDLQPTTQSAPAPDQVPDTGDE